MDFFNDIIADVRAFYNGQKTGGEVRERFCSTDLSWPAAGANHMVFQSDTGLELGHPSLKSVVFHMWTEDPSLVNDGRISLIGPDINESSAGMLPFGKIVLINGHGFTDDNAHERYCKMGLARFEVSLEGYMMRAASQYLREWGRVSRNAMAKGFSLFNLGNAIIKKYHEMEYVTGTEVIFITSDRGGFEHIIPMAEKVEKINSAMSKMTEEMSFDCDECEYLDVCSEVSEMRNMRKRREKSGKERRPDA